MATVGLKGSPGRVQFREREPAYCEERICGTNGFEAWSLRLEGVMGGERLV